MVYTYLAPLLAQTMGYGRNGVSATFLVYGFGAVAGNLLAGRIADRVGTGPTLVALALAQVAILPLFSTLPLPPALLFALLAGLGELRLGLHRAAAVAADPDRPRPRRRWCWR